MSKAASTRKRHPHSEETKRKIGDAHRGRKLPESQIANMRKPKSEEHRLKLSEAMLGRPGHPHTLESRAKISEANKGHTVSSDRRAKQSASMSRLAADQADTEEGAFSEIPRVIPKCHSERAHKADGLCAECYNSQWYEKTPDESPEEFETRYNRRNRKSHFSHMMARYGITVRAYSRMNATQGGLCAVCREPCLMHSRLSVDHDHKTGYIRGLLCFACNTGLGHFRDDGARLIRAAEYLAQSAVRQIEAS